MTEETKTTAVFNIKLEQEVIDKVDEIGRVKYNIKLKNYRTQILRMIVKDAWELLYRGEG